MSERGITDRITAGPETLRRIAEFRAIQPIYAGSHRVADILRTVADQMDRDLRTRGELHELYQSMLREARDTLTELRDAVFADGATYSDYDPMTQPLHKANELIARLSARLGDCDERA